MSSVALFPAVSQFGEVRTVEKTPVIQLVSVYPISALRDITTIAGDAGITTTGGEHRLQTTALANDAATLDSAERGSYGPGYSAEVGIGIRIPTMPTGAQVATWGLSDGTDGIYYGVDATGLYVARLKGGSESKIRQVDWNADRLDGTGTSALTLDLSRGNIFQISFTWYGYGVIEYQVGMLDTNNRQRIITVHRESIDGSTSIEQPNLPIRAHAENGATASAFNLYVGGRQYSVVGRYVPSERRTSVSRELVGSIGTSSTPMLTVRRKSDFLDVPLRVSGVDAIVSDSAMLEIWLNATVATASYGAIAGVAAGETAIERDVSSSTISGGVLLYATLIGASGAGNSRSGRAGVTGLSVEIPARQPVTVALRALSGTITGSVVLRMLEDW